MVGWFKLVPIFQPQLGASANGQSGTINKIKQETSKEEPTTLFDVGHVLLEKDKFWVGCRFTRLFQEASGSATFCPKPLQPSTVGDWVG